eukprot:2016529-Rhodomonas_salina.1
MDDLLASLSKTASQHGSQARDPPCKGPGRGLGRSQSGELASGGGGAEEGVQPREEAMACDPQRRAPPAAAMCQGASCAGGGEDADTRVEEVPGAQTDSHNGQAAGAASSQIALDGEFGSLLDSFFLEGSAPRAQDTAAAAAAPRGLAEEVAVPEKLCEPCEEEARVPDEAASVAAEARPASQDRAAEAE